MSNLVREKLLEGLGVIEAVAHDADLHATLTAAAEATADALQSGHKLMVAGNGGSAADAQHLTAEFVNQLVHDRPAMRAVALTTNSSILSSVGNDRGFDSVFERQVEALGQTGDVFLGISTSGKSSNILRALERCREMGITTIGLTGNAGGMMPALCDYCVRVPSDVTMYIQQAHLALEHIFCLIAEQKYSAADQRAAVAPAATAKG